MFPVFVLQRNLWLGILISRLIQSTPLQTIEGIEKGLSINQRNSKVKSEVQAAIVSKQAKDWQYAKQLKGEIPFENLDTADLKAHLTEPSFQKEIKGRSRAEHTSLASLLNNEKSFQEVRKTKCSSETEKTVISGVSEFSAAQDSSEVASKKKISDFFPDNLFKTTLKSKIKFAGCASVSETSPRHLRGKNDLLGCISKFKTPIEPQAISRGSGQAPKVSLKKINSGNKDKQNLIKIIPQIFPRFLNIWAYARSQDSPDKLEIVERWLNDLLNETKVLEENKQILMERSSNLNADEKERLKLKKFFDKCENIGLQTNFNKEQILRHRKTLLDFQNSESSNLEENIRQNKAKLKIWEYILSFFDELTEEIGFKPQSNIHELDSFFIYRHYAYKDLVSTMKILLKLNNPTQKSNKETTKSKLIQIISSVKKENEIANSVLLILENEAPQPSHVLEDDFLEESAVKFAKKILSEYQDEGKLSEFINLLKNTGENPFRLRTIRKAEFNPKASKSSIFNSNKVVANVENSTGKTKNVLETLSSPNLKLPEQMLSECTGQKMIEHTVSKKNHIQDFSEKSSQNSMNKGASSNIDSQEGDTKLDRIQPLKLNDKGAVLKLENSGTKNVFYHGESSNINLNKPEPSLVKHISKNILDQESLSSISFQKSNQNIEKTKSERLNNDPLPINHIYRTESDRFYSGYNSKLKSNEKKARVINYYQKIKISNFKMN